MTLRTVYTYKHHLRILFMERHPHTHITKDHFKLSRKQLSSLHILPYGPDYKPFTAVDISDLKLFTAVRYLQVPEKTL